MRSLVCLAVLAACGDSTDLPPDAAMPVRELGMNDVTMLLPLPTDLARPVLAKLAPALIPTNLATGLTLGANMGPKDASTYSLDDFQVVAVRFDPCARDHVGTCLPSEDGRLRLVLQPLYVGPDGIGANDIALHAFYVLPNADLPAVVAELRVLATLQAAPLASALAVSPALAADPSGTYAQRLQTLVLRYARADNLVQLTAIGQNKFSAAFEWIFGGYIKQAGAWNLITIPAINETRQILQVGGGDTVYDSRPAVDHPYRIATAMSGFAWADASAEDKQATLETLAEIENPVRHDTNDLQCAACHISTFLSAHRGASIDADLTQLARRYQTAWNTTVDTLANYDGRVVRALGYAATHPILSRRVANDTAFVLEELAHR